MKIATLFQVFEVLIDLKTPIFNLRIISLISRLGRLLESQKIGALINLRIISFRRLKISFNVREKASKEHMLETVIHKS